MKKFLIRSICIICMTYLVLSLGTNIHNEKIAKDGMKELGLLTTSVTENDTNRVTKNFNTTELETLSNYAGRLEIIYADEISIWIAGVIGVTLAICLALFEKYKEGKNTKVGE